jgi:hypothetical protein
MRGRIVSMTNDQSQPPSMIAKSLLIRASIVLILVAVVGFSVFKLRSTNQPPPSPMSSSPFPPRPDCYFLEMHSSDGQHSKEYVNGKLKRLEIYGPTSELPQLYIYRRDKGVTWSAMPGSKTLRETAASPATAATAAAVNALIAWTNEGTAKIEGRKCIRFVGTYVEPQAGAGYYVMGTGRAYEETFIDAENGLPVRHATYDMLGKLSVVNERTAFDLNPPDLALFEVPDGYSVERSESSQ